MTHDERVWELYRGFAAAALNADFIGAYQEKSKQEEYAERYYATAETFATVFERLTNEREEMVRTDSPFERRVPDFEVTAMEC